MQARMIQERNVVIVHLSGRVDVETAVPFRDACLNRLSGQRVVFDFQSLSFVGSCGILPFLETMQAFHVSNPGGVKFSGVGTEFKKVFAATPLHTIEIFETASLAVDAFINPRPKVQAASAITAAPMADPSLSEESAEAATEPQAFIAFRSEPEEPIASAEDDEAYA